MAARNAKQDNKIAGDKDAVVRAIPLACADERAAVEFLEAMRWGDSPACPRCGADDVYQMTERGSNERNERYLWRCRDCGRQYSVRIGTIMEDSRIPLRHWCFAFWAACSSKKGVSALQIRRQTGLSYKSALFLMHRIRWAMANHDGGPLSGDVEADETYVGGKPRKLSKQAKDRGAKAPRGFSAEARENKTPVFAIVERGGEARAHVPADVTGDTLQSAVRRYARADARLHTDEAPGYIGVGREMAAHHTVHHGSREYARQDGDVTATTNSVEAFFSLLKRGVIGTFHNVSRKHLHRYVSEFEYRWNTRHVDDGARIARLIGQSEGVRLRYREP